MIAPARDSAVVSDDKTFGTAAPDAPITRADFERALRYLNLSDIDLRDTLLQLAAQVVTLTDELTRRVDRVEPHPAAPNTPAREATGTVEQSVGEALPETLQKLRMADAKHVGRLWLETDAEDKYEIASPDIPCAELLPICKARCCTYVFALSSADLDEGVIRWDYGRPYMIRQRASDGYCVHNTPGTHGCTVHAQRPAVCRRYDCRNDKRVWLDFEKRILAPDALPDSGGSFEVAPSFNLMDRVRAIQAAAFHETSAVRRVYPDNAPIEGPPSEQARIERNDRVTVPED